MLTNGETEEVISDAGAEQQGGDEGAERSSDSCESLDEGVGRDAREPGDCRVVEDVQDTTASQLTQSMLPPRIETDMPANVMLTMLVNWLW